MTTTDFQSSFVTKASPAEILDKIGRVSDWWTRHVEGKSQHLHDEFTVTFGETFVTFVVTQEVPEKLVVWRCTACNLHWINDKREWEGTEVVWDVSSDGKQTTLKMTHVGLTPEVECYQMCERGWTFYVAESLRKFVVEGIGLPDKDRENRPAVS
jgi:hypothetical protein